MNRAGNNSTKGRAGFSLVEVLIAICIFTSGIMAAMYLFPLGVRDIGRAKILTAAAFLGQAKMEEELYLPSGVHTYPYNGNFSPEYPALIYNVDKVALAGKPTLFQISVVVSDGAKTLVRFDTLKSLQ